MSQINLLQRSESMKKIIAIAAFSALLLTGCTFSPLGKGIIKVNDTVITKSEFDKTLNKEINSSMFKDILRGNNRDVYYI